MGQQKQRIVYRFLGNSFLTFTFLGSSFLSIAQVHAGEFLHFKGRSLPINELKQKGTETTRHLRNATTPTPQSVETQYYVLQFKQTISAEDQTQLKNLGVDVLRYIPDDAYIVRAKSEQLQMLLKANSNAKDFAVYHSDFRLSPELQVRHVFNRVNFKTVRLQLFNGVHAQSLVMQLMNEGFIVLESSDSVIVVRAQVKDLNQLAALEGVEWMSEQPTMRLKHFVWPHKFDDGGTNPPPPAAVSFADLTGYESGTKIMNFYDAWSAGLKGQGQTVGVADTGLDTGNSATLFSDFSNHKASYVLGYGSRTWADFQGHGTHVMGSVGSVGAGSQGAITGGATESKLIAQSLWSTTHNTLTTPNDLQEIFKQAYQAGARVHSNSWGDPSARGVYNTDTTQVDQFVWDNPDMVILFAAGNDGVDANSDGRIDAGSISAPATSKNIISVGASENLVSKGGVQAKLGQIEFDTGKPWPAEPIASDTISNNPNGMVAFSSRGPTSDGRIKPDIVAPGSNILSNCSHAEGAEELWGRFNADYCFSGGTSMSTPLVAGAAAVIRQKLVSMNYPNPSAALVKAVMLHTAYDMYPGQYGEVGEAQGQELLKPGLNADQGYGRVDVRKAIAAKYVFEDEKTGLATGAQKAITASGSLRKVTLVYTDAPGAPEAQKALVNNLDLEVMVDGQPVGFSRSQVDNTEQVVLENQVQNATIVVKATSVVMGRNGKQPFAVIYSE